jgi:hypothetical protein
MDDDSGSENEGTKSSALRPRGMAIFVSPENAHEVALEARNKQPLEHIGGLCERFASIQPGTGIDERKTQLWWAGEVSAHGLFPPGGIEELKGQTVVEVVTRPPLDSTIFMHQVQTNGQMDLVAVPNEALASKLEERGFVRVKSFAFVSSEEAASSILDPSGGAPGGGGSSSLGSSSSSSSSLSSSSSILDPSGGAPGGGGSSSLGSSPSFSSSSSSDAAAGGSSSTSILIPKDVKLYPSVVIAAGSPSAAMQVISWMEVRRDRPLSL